MSEHLCIVCPALRPGEEARQPNTMPVCDGCRAWPDPALQEIVKLHALLPAYLARGRTHGQRVTGSREAPLPLLVDPLDLTMPARAASVHDDPVPDYETVQITVEVWKPATPEADRYLLRKETMRARRPILDQEGRPVLRPSDDQHGQLGVASVLDSWVTDWRETIDCGNLRPAPTVADLARWLRIWLPTALDKHPAVDEFVAELKRLRRVLRAVVGVSEIKPEYLEVPCRRCDLFDLHRLPGEDRIECGSCGDLLTEDEYLRWVRLLAADLKAVG